MMWNIFTSLLLGVVSGILLWYIKEVRELNDQVDRQSDCLDELFQEKIDRLKMESVQSEGKHLSDRFDAETGE